jgi:hypothetical protein
VGRGECGLGEALIWLFELGLFFLLGGCQGRMGVGDWDR